MNLIPTKKSGLFVLIVLTVQPENQQKVIDTIHAAGDPNLIPGLLSLDLLRSLDGTQVINHMHWTDKTAFDQARADIPAIQSLRTEVLGLIEHATSNLYEVAPHS
ncbi:antibiotic biosynthesis monooxygenase [Nocardia sp. NPDC020380]|uniref:antibiotic biosynthesis monooxygenase n=1 Tax=Nocardia sp. NPDC020380 TaxID=3364309 RepID=UPI0037BBD0EF